MSNKIVGAVCSIIVLFVLLWAVIKLPEWVEPSGIIIAPIWIVLICIVIIVAIGVGIYHLFR